jgi:hypothetical protein
MINILFVFAVNFCHRSVTSLRSGSWPTRCALERKAVLLPGHTSNTHVAVPVRRRPAVCLADWHGALPGQRHSWFPSVFRQSYRWIVAVLMWSPRKLQQNKRWIWPSTNYMHMLCFFFLSLSFSCFRCYCFPCCFQLTSLQFYYWQNVGSPAHFWPC